MHLHFLSSSTQGAVPCMPQLSPQVGVAWCRWDANWGGEGSGWGNLKRYTCFVSQLSLYFVPVTSCHYLHPYYTMRSPPFRMKAFSFFISMIRVPVGGKSLSGSLQQELVKWESSMLDPLPPDRTLGSLGCLLGEMTQTFSPRLMWW